MSDRRVYLDYNATAPLTEPCKLSMIEIMNLVGNASSIHKEGRQAKAIIEKAREQISEAIDADTSNLVFTSGATEGASLVLRDQNVKCSRIEHPCVLSWCDPCLNVSESGRINNINNLKKSMQLANSETGIIQDLPNDLFMSDIVQAIGKIQFSFKKSDISTAIISGHKIGGPQGVGVVVLNPKVDITPQIIGGGQEMGRRSGTENLVAIAGFGSAVEFAKKKLDDGLWDEVKALRDYLEAELFSNSPNTKCVGHESIRLPNTSCLITPGWKGQMQVMQMDLAGFAISSGSACSSGKVVQGEVLGSLGYDSDLADCAVRVSIGTETTKKEIQCFVKEWAKAFSDWTSCAA